MDLAMAQAMMRNHHQIHRNFERNMSIKNRPITNHKFLVSNLSPNIGLYDLVDDECYSEQENEKYNSHIQNLIITANKLLGEKVNKNQQIRENLTVVKFYIVFLRLGEIDNVQERFEATAYIESFWEDDLIEGNKYDPVVNWNPEIFVHNSVGNLKQEINYKIKKIGKTTRIYEMRKIRGFFWERLELQDFPLDEQDLSITIASARSKDEVYFELSDENECTINGEDFQQQQEWILFSNINSTRRFIYDRYKDYERSAYTISSKIARRPGYFLNNAYMMIFFITILGFVPFSFPNDSPQFRIQTTLLLYLSEVNFRWIVTQRLPSISYLTILDKYAITALVFLVLLCAWHAIIGSNLISHTLQSYRDQIDRIAFYIIASCFLLFHLIYTLYFVWKMLRYNKIGKENEVNTSYKNNHKVESKSISTSNVKPIIKPIVTNSNLLIPKYNEQININSEIKYRNLVESPSNSMSCDINAGTPKAQRNS